MVQPHLTQNKQVRDRIVYIPLWDWKDHWKEVHPLWVVGENHKHLQGAIDFVAKKLKREKNYAISVEYQIFGTKEIYGTPVLRWHTEDSQLLLYHKDTQMWDTVRPDLLAKLRPKAYVPVKKENKNGAAESDIEAD